MKITLDTDEKTCTLIDEGGERTLPLYSDEAFAAISRWYVKVGWNQRYSYTFSWFGRPIIQMPDDMVRIQEIIHRIRPDVIVETGVAHGGSLIFYASLCEAMGHGKVIGIDIEIRPHNRKAIEEHPLSHRITLIEGSSTSPKTVEKVATMTRDARAVLVLLDSNHSYQHVTDELELYAPFVTEGSYIVATDGLMEDLWDVPAGTTSWRLDNPARAARDFADRRADFRLEDPKWPFNESTLDRSLVTHWTNAYLRREAAADR